MTADPNFDAVLAAARAGDGRAATALFEALARPVAGYLRGRGVEDPDGAANEVFVRVFTRIGRFVGDETQFRSWVFTIARNLAVDEQRVRARRGECVAIDAHVARLASREVAVEERVVATRRVDELLAPLSPDQRDVMLLRFVAELSLEETANAMGKRVTAIKALQHRAIGALRKQLPRPQRATPAAPAASTAVLAQPA